MEVRSRYQILSTQDRLPWYSGCPIQLHMVRLTQDLLANQVILQLLLVNVTDNPIKSVCVQLVCQDADGIVLQQIPSVLMKNVHASAHHVFDCPQPIFVASGTMQADVIPEKVIFCDGQVWTRPAFLQGQLLPPPTPIADSDPCLPQMRQDVAGTALSIQYYFEQHNSFWYCSCGQANPLAAQNCGRCCGNKQWLQEHLSRREPPRTALYRQDLGDYFGRSPGEYQPVLPAAPQPPAPTPPEQLVVDPYSGELVPMEQYNAMMRAMYYQKKEQAAAPVSPPPISKPRLQAGWIVLIVTLVLAALVAGFFFFLPKTNYGRYQQALQAMKAGNYEQAYVDFQTLGDYEDAQDNADLCRYSQAKALYDSENYSAALPLFQELSDYHNSGALAADCCYRQAVELMEKSQYEDAINKLKLAKTYDGTDASYEQKLQLCAYQLGVAAQTDKNFDLALSWYAQCSDYADTQQRMAACKQAANSSAQTSPGSTSGGSSPASADVSLAQMYAYVNAHRSATDQTTSTYLEALCKAKYQDSQTIYDALYGWSVSAFFNSSANDLTTHLEQAVLGQTLYVHYIVSGGPPNGSLKMKYTYQKPNGATGDSALNSPCTAGSTGNIYWKGGIYAASEEQKTGTLTVSYYNADTNVQLCSASISITATSGTDGKGTATPSPKA